jgi:hypothetical protein
VVGFEEWCESIEGSICRPALTVADLGGVVMSLGPNLGNSGSEWITR